MVMFQKKAPPMFRGAFVVTLTATRNSAGLLLHLRRDDGVFYRLGDAELYYLLRRDLDRFARGRVASHAGFALLTNQPANAGDDKNALFLGFPHRNLGEVDQKRFDSLGRNLVRIGQFLD